MPESRFKLAVAQLTSTDDREQNLAECQRLAAEAADRGAAMVAFPECYGYMARREPDRFAIAEVLDHHEPGPILAATMEMAKKHGIWVVGGGVAEVLPEEEGGEITRTHNTCIVVSPDGELAARYRKIHLFDVDIPGKVTLRESETTEAGREIVSVSTPLAKLGLTICYDVRFPELYRKLAVDDAAEIVLVPSAFTIPTGEAHWHVLLRARAIENQCYIVAPAQVGRHNEKRASYGHSLVVDPWGEVLAEIEEGTGIAVADVDPGRLTEVRRRLPCYDHRVLDH